MTITPAEFWSDEPEGEGEAPPPLTAEGVAATERALGVRLPAAYLDLLRVRNGGATRGWECPVEDGDVQWAEEVFELFGVPPLSAEQAAALDGPALAETISDDVHGSILVTPYMTREWKLPPRQALLSGDGHTWLSLDYRAGEDPKVVFLQDDGWEFSVSVLAESFDQFLAKLRPAEEE